MMLIETSHPSAESVARLTVRLTPLTASEPLTAMKRDSSRGATMTSSPGFADRPPRAYRADTVDVAGHQMTAYRVPQSQRGLDVDVPGPIESGRADQTLGRDVAAETRAVDGGGRHAGTVQSDAVPGPRREAADATSVDRQPHATGCRQPFDALDPADALDQSREHASVQPCTQADITTDHRDLDEFKRARLREIGECRQMQHALGLADQHRRQVDQQFVDDAGTYE